MQAVNRLLHQPATYQIQVHGRLNENWSTWFDGMNITVGNGAGGVTITTLTGVLADQAALHGLISRIRDMGLPLLLVQYMGGKEQ